MVQGAFAMMFLAVLLFPPTITSACVNQTLVRHNRTRYSATFGCLVMFDCVFVDEKPGTDGGAIFINSSDEDTSITGCSFLNCSALLAGSSTSGGAYYLASFDINITSCCISGCSASFSGNSFYFAGNGTRWVEIVLIERSAPEAAFFCLGGIHYSEACIANLSSVNSTNSYAFHCPCIFTLNLRRAEVCTVALTGRFLNVFNNSGDIGFLTANAVGRYGWYLFNCNFYNNSITSGVLMAPANGTGMNVDSCIFCGNIADIESESGAMSNKFNLTHCVFSDEFPSSAIVSLSECVEGSMTASWAVSNRLCPTYSASASASDTTISIGLIVGIIVVLLILILGIISGVIIISRRKRRLSDRSSLTERSSLHLDIVDDHFDTTQDTTMLTFVSGITECTSDLSGTLLT
jgi:hypothetical protein